MKPDQSWLKLLASKKPKKTRIPAAPSIGEETFALNVKAYRLIEPRRQYRFCADRKWRVDFAWPTAKLAVEVEGGIWAKGRHVRGTGFESDCRKYNCLAADGWLLLRFSTNMVKSGEAINTTKDVLAQLASPVTTRRQGG